MVVCPNKLKSASSLGFYQPDYTHNDDRGLEPMEKEDVAEPPT